MRVEAVILRWLKKEFDELMVINLDEGDVV